MSFNQDSSCFALGTEDGFSVFNCDPPTIRFKRNESDTSEKSIGIVKMLNKSNIFALTGGKDTHRKIPLNKVAIWDDFQKKCVSELEFRSEVTGVELRRDLILITIVDKAYAYSFTDLKMETTYETCPNLGGLASLSTGDKQVVAVPGHLPGTVTIDNLSDGYRNVIKAHENGLAAIALNSDGTKLATASIKGTLIRIWDTQSKELLKEFRRGLEPVEITSIAFDQHTSSRLVVCSNKGTAHIFSLQDPADNQKSSLSYFSNYLPSYFDSEWSSISFEVPHGSKCAFGNNDINMIYVISPERVFLRYSYDTSTGFGEIKETVNILDL